MPWNINRRQLLQIGAISGASWLLPGMVKPRSAAAVAYRDEQLRSNPDYALQALMDGNKRFS
ncbi:MAG: hypothetical protein HC810_02260, partial [Acaryochloridaceae cyanobacterium RL_2_7]|nr:hypothetical protein [Acaryochloridaceae cyanobacterium RL_2_7]